MVHGHKMAKMTIGMEHNLVTMAPSQICSIGTAACSTTIKDHLVFYRLEMVLGLIPPKIGRMTAPDGDVVGRFNEGLFDQSSGTAGGGTRFGEGARSPVNQNSARCIEEE